MHSSAAVRLLRPALIALPAAVIGNLLLLGIARAAGADMNVTNWAGDPEQVGVAAVLFATLVPSLLGLGVAALISRHRRLLTVLAALAAVVTVASLASPLALDSDAPTRYGLAAMHLVVGAAYLTVVVRHIRALGQAPSPADATALAGR